MGGLHGANEVRRIMPIENLNLWECPNGHKEFRIEVREDCKVNIKCTTCGATKVVPFLMIQYHANPWAMKESSEEEE